MRVDVVHISKRGKGKGGSHKEKKKRGWLGLRVDGRLAGYKI